MAFPKKQRLKNQLVIGHLFKKGQSKSFYPLRIIWADSPQSPNPANSSSIKVAFSVSKRNFPRAVDRNRIKRQLREAFRLHQQLLKPDLELNQNTEDLQKKTRGLMILFVAKEKLPSQNIHKKMKVALKFLANLDT